MYPTVLVGVFARVRGEGTGTAGRGSVGNFSLSICLSWSPGAYGGMVLGAVRAWLLGRTVANL